MQTSISPGLAAGRVARPLACSPPTLSSSPVHVRLTFAPGPQALEQFPHYLCFVE